MEKEKDEILCSYIFKCYRHTNMEKEKDEILRSYIFKCYRHTKMEKEKNPTGKMGNNQCRVKE